MAVAAKTRPPIKDFAIQTKAIEFAEGRDFTGIYLDPGMGKSRVALKIAERWHRQGKIDAMVVLAKNSGKTNWVIWDHMIEDPELDEDAVAVHLRDYPVIKGLWISGATGQDKREWNNFEKRINGDTRGKLVILAINYQALLSEVVLGFLMDFMDKFRTVLCADESTQIAEISAKRTKRAIKLARKAPKRLALSGTPVMKRPLKIFAQAKFLDEKALGYTSFYPFRNRYARMGGFEMRQVMGYENLDELSDKIASFSIRAQAKDHLDMPEQQWHKRRVYMTPEQAKAYKTMREEFYAEVDGGLAVTAPIVIAQMTRLAQIVGGFLPDEDGNPVAIIPPDRNPKALETMDIIDDAPGQSIVWCRFKPEIAAVAALCRDAKVSFYEFHGEVGETDRVRVRKAFQRGERQVVLATPSSGGDSIDEFKVADTAIFYSNDADTEKRKQAEGRTWRAGSAKLHKTINYYDILVPNTTDTKYMQILRRDSKLSALLLRESWKEWI
jgi:SNF2 family DNA or RNA helicase